MNRLCPNKLTCRDGSSDYPVLNISSEAPDSIVFTGFTWTDPNPRPCLVDCGVQTISDCFGTVYSFTSQDEANMLARLIEVICNQHGGGGGTINGQQFTNDAQTAFFSCGAIGPGRTFSTVFYTVPAGSVVSPLMNPADGAAWIAASNAAALALAQERVSHSGGCIDPPRSSALNFICCVNKEFLVQEARYTLSGPNSAAFYNWTISSGSLPPGLTLVNGGHDNLNQAFASVEGTPTTLGNFTFTVRASRVDSPNCYIEIPDAMDVFGITNTTLPSGTVGTPYIEQLLTLGGTTPVTFTLAPGSSLPDGLSLSSSGLISGTPTTVTP